MINAPDSPTVGQIFTAAGASWIWDGTKWKGVPQVGVTDGSNAAAGQVGEYLSAMRTSASPLALSATWQAIATITLTAGDWDVWGEISFTSPTATGMMAGFLGQVVTGVPADHQGEVTLYQTWSLNQIWIVAIAPIRLNTTSGGTVSIWGYTPMSGVTAYGKIAARRRR